MKDAVLLTVLGGGIPATIAAIGAWRSSGIKTLIEQIDRIESKLDRHIEWHVNK